MNIQNSDFLNPYGVDAGFTKSFGPLYGERQNYVAMVKWLEVMIMIRNNDSFTIRKPRAY